MPYMYIYIYRSESRNPATSEMELFQTVLNFWAPVFCCKVICLKFSWVSVPASYKMCIQTMQYNEVTMLMEKVTLIFNNQKSSVLYMEQVLTSN